MKREKLLSGLSAAVLAFLLGFGSTACMATGLRLPADLFLLACGCAVGALIPVICLSLRRGELILSSVAAVSTLFLVFSSRFQEQLTALCYSALRFYNLGYGIPIPDAVDGYTADSQLLPLLFVAGLVMVVTVRTVLCRKQTFAAVATALLPLASCLVVTDTVPDMAPIFLLMLGLVLLMMTQSVRRRDAAQGNRLTAILFLPAIAALLGLMALIPQDTYTPVGQIDSLQDIMDWFVQKIPTVETTSQGELVISAGGTAKNKVDLSRIGRRPTRTTPVMELSTEYSGTLYLRSRDYDAYTGLGWEVTDGRVEESYGLSPMWRYFDETVSIRVLSRQGQYYLPCYSTEYATLIGGMLPNPDYQTEYSLKFSTLRSDWEQLYHGLESGLVVGDGTTEPPPDPVYLALPDATRQQAEAIVNQLAYTDSDDHSVAESIGSYVRASASYDTNTGRIPVSETDFAMWFLRESETGYCVHFATAATVLLRAAGIPARYVEGYMVETHAKRTTIVRQKQAHAWVEYYLDHVGWVILDPTPSLDELPGATTEPTEPSVTTPLTTKPTTPTHPQQTEQTEGTMPSDIQITGSSGTQGDTPQPPVIPQWFLNLLAALIGILVFCILIIGQWSIRRYLKQKKMRQGSTNRQALRRYREAGRMARLSKTPVPDELRALAEKAKFSQHALTKDELNCFDVFLRTCVQALRQRPWYCRLIFRWIFAAY